MEQRTDMQLLRDYSTRGSEDAFAVLVTRHVDLVYSTALREVRNPHLAQEVTQAVFLVLVRKAPTLGRDTILAAWLHRTARYAAADALKLQWRRLKYEQEAAQVKPEPAPDESSWQQVAPLLDEAVGRLNAKDRAAILLRFFENKSLREVGAALDTSEDSAQKRVARALARLREFFIRRGVVLSAAALGSMLAGKAVQAAPGAVAALATAAAGPGAVIPLTTSTLVKTTLQMILLKKIQTVGAFTALFLVTAGTLSVLAQKAGQPPAPAPISTAAAADRATPLGALRYLADALNAYDGDKVADSYLAGQPGEKRFIQAMASLVRAEGEFKRKVDARFGEKPMRDALARRGAPLMSIYFGQDGLDMAEEEIRGDRATVKLPDSREPTQEHRVELRRTGGIWKVNATDAGSQASEQAGRKAATFEAIATTLLATAGQVEEGRFKTFAEVMRALRKGTMAAATR